MSRGGLESFSAKGAYHVDFLTLRGEEAVTYELTVILRITDSVEYVKDNVIGILQKHGVVVISEESWDIKKLAYPIDKESKGYYIFMSIESPPDAIKKIVGDFRLESDILRYLFVKLGRIKSA